MHLHIAHAIHLGDIADGKYGGLRSGGLCRHLFVRSIQSGVDQKKCDFHTTARRSVLRFVLRAVMLICVTHRHRQRNARHSGTFRKWSLAWCSRVKNATELASERPFWTASNSCHEATRSPLQTLEPHAINGTESATESH